MKWKLLNETRLDLKKDLAWLKICFGKEKKPTREVKILEHDIYVLISIFCDVGDFCKEFEPEWRKILIKNQNQLLGKTKTRNRKSKLSLSEAITIVIMFHKIGYRTFKDYFIRFVTGLKQYFPKLMSIVSIVSKEKLK